jgi:hypothetical protein
MPVTQPYDSLPKRSLFATRTMTDEETSNVKRWFAEDESWLEIAERLKMNLTMFKNKPCKGEFRDEI